MQKATLLSQLCSLQHVHDTTCHPAWAGQPGWPACCTQHSRNVLSEKLNIDLQHTGNVLSVKHAAVNVPT